MPYSSDSGKRFTERALLRLQIELGDKFFTTNKVLDIGAGSGTYSTLYSNSLLPRSKFKWEGVEIWEPYLEKFNLTEKYDSIHLQDARTFFEKNESHYDLIFMGDVIEHMTKEEAIKMVDLAKLVGHLIIISIPIIHYPQDEFEGNPYEAHVKDDWSVKEVLETFSNIVYYGVENEIGVFLIGGEGINTSSLSSVLSPKIGVYAIGKNESKFASRFFNSVKFADQVVICDTGSTDDTLEILKNQITENYNHDQKDRYVLKSISVQPFRFDDARNTALMLLRPDLDLCVSIDFDELMEDNWYFTLSTEANNELFTQGFITDRWNHRFKTIWDWDAESKNVSEHWHERIHTRHNYLWKLPVHEVLLKQGSPENIKWLNNFMMIQKPDNSKSRSSYLPMLEMSLKEDPTRWKSWSFYASDLSASGRLDDAVEAIKKAKSCKDADQAFLCNCLSRYFQAQGKINEAIIELTNASMIAPHLREYKVYLARLYLQIGERVKAKMMVDMASTITDRSWGYEYDPGVWGENFENFCKDVR